MCHDSLLPYFYFHSHSPVSTVNLHYTNSAVKLARINKTQTQGLIYIVGFWFVVPFVLLCGYGLKTEAAHSSKMSVSTCETTRCLNRKPTIWTVIVVKVFPLYIRPDCLNLTGAAGGAVFRVLKMLHEALYPRNHTTDTWLQYGLFWVKSSWFCYISTDKCRDSAFEYFWATYLQIFNHSQFIVRSPLHSPFCPCIQNPRVGDESYPGCCAYWDGMVSVETMKDCSLQGERCDWRDRFLKWECVLREVWM
jgi:hypothetical protein